MLAVVAKGAYVHRMIRSLRIDWRFAIAATLILTCLFTLASVGRPGGPPFVVLHNRQTITWLVWLALSPAIIASAKRFPFGEGTPLRWLLRHVAVGAAFSAASILLTGAVRYALATVGHAGHDSATPPLVASVATGLLLYALIAVSYQAVAYHRSAREREAIATRLRADLAEARLATLEGQLHPHFLFNALNSIAALMRIDTTQAETMLEQLSELLRATLRTNPMTEVPLADALRIAEQYLAIEQVRFGARLRTSIAATGDARRALVPQLLLQPLVENAVRHGIAPLESGGLVSITASVEQGVLSIRVEDDGVGYGNAPAARAGNGLGLRSVRSMLSHLYGAEQQFDVSPGSPAGTVVAISMPFRS